MPNNHPETKTNENATTAATKKKDQRKEPNPLLGCSAGILAMIAGTALWILIAQKYRMPLMSIIVAFGIAYAIRYAGNTKDSWYGIIGAVLSFIAAIAGNIATGICIVCLKYPEFTPKAIIAHLNFENAITLIRPIGGIWIAISFLAAIIIGFWFSFKHAPKQPLL